MQQQIQKFLEEYFENPKSSNKETIESNKPLAANENGTTTLKGKSILQEKDKTKNLDHHEDITKPVMNLNKSGCTMYSRKEHIKKLMRIPSATHRSDKENTQLVGMQFNIKENTSNHTGHTEPNEKSMMDLLYNIMNRLEIIESNQKGALRLKEIHSGKGSDQSTQNEKMQKVFRNVIFDPNKEDLIRLNEVLDQTWENIETAIIAAAKKTIRRINRLAETKVNKFPHSRENLEGWLTEAYTWYKKLEKLLIDDAESHKVKKYFFSNNINTSALQPHCENITSDNRQKLALIEHWTEMHIQGDKCSLLKCGGCNLNTKGKENECIISCNKNLIRGAAVGITKRENNWITNFPTTLLKDKPEYHLTPVQECPLLQLKEIDYAE
ncbi:27921_t:CDS:2, partial [Gigaspora margarita]